MGLRNRTPIGALRDQRRRAELQKSRKQVTATQLRVRALDSLRSRRTADSTDQEKSLLLIERLRQALQEDTSQNDPSKEYDSLQDELDRVNQRQMAASEQPEAPQDLPMDGYRSSAQPFTLVLVPEVEEKTFSKRIRRLDSLLTNLDSYRAAVPVPDAAPLFRSLSLAPEAVDAESLPKEHSDHAADLVQVSVQQGPTADMQIPASLALSLLND